MTTNSAHAPARRRIQLLYVGDAALARECFGRPGASIEVTGAVPEVDRPLDLTRADGQPFDILLIEHGHPGVRALAILEQLRARNLQLPAIVVADWDEELAAHALRLGASDYVIKNRASFRAVYFRLHRLMTQAAAIRAQSSERESDRELEALRRKLTEVEGARDAVEGRLRDAVETIIRTRHGRLADAVAAAQEHAQRESEFAAKIADANSVARALEQQVRDQRAILSLIEERTARAEQIAATAARRQSEIESTLREEGAKRRSLETQLAHVNEALRESEAARSADAAAFADQLAQQQTAFSRQNVEMGRARALVEQKLHEATAATKQVRDASAIAAAAAAEREAVVLADLRAVTDSRDRLERRLVDADAALSSAEQRIVAADQAGRQRLNERQAEFHAELSRLHATMDGLREEIVVLEYALQQSEDQRVSDVAASVAKFTNLQADYDAHIVAADASRNMLQTQLAELERSLADSRARHESEIAGVVRELAETRRQADARLAEAISAAEGLERQLRESEAERHRDQEGYASLLTDAATQFADAQEAAEQRFAEAATAIELLESRLRDSETTRERAREQHASEMAQSRVSLDQQQRQTETWLTDAAAVANALERRLVDLSAELEQVRHEAVQERETTLAHAAARQAEFEIRLGEEIATQGALNDELQHARFALDAASDRHRLDIAAAAARLADSEERAAVRLAQADTAIKVAESKRAEATAALNRVVQQATAERQAAAAETAERHAQFKAALAREASQREAAEHTLLETRAAAERAHHEFTETLSAAEARALEERSNFEKQTAYEHAEWERVSLAAAERIRELTDQLDHARQALARAEEQIHGLRLEHQELQAQADQRQRATDRDLAQLRTERDTLQQSLDHTRATADEILTRVTQDRSIERARLEATVADLEVQLKEQSERARASERQASTRLAESGHRVEEMRAAKERANESIVQLENQLKALRHDLESAKKRGEVLRATAERLPILEKEIDDVRAESHRQFEESPASWFRCRRSGEIIHANRAMRSLVGYEPLELQQLDFGEIVFESANDFRWVVDRCLASLSTQSMETPWRRKDGRRIIVRVVAVPATAESVDLIAEDVTHMRELEEKLRNAQRMESVARYGSEVAITCQGLLAHVRDEGRQWLAGIESDTVRYRGELLLDEVTRASAYLGQLAVYTEEQQNIPDLVDVNKVLRDLEPVLKRVAGHNIDIVLPKTSAPLNLDVEPRPVERMLVNVAAYGRERMPLGGRLKIEVDSVVVDREFVAKHPHVRPGEHVLLIVNEQRRVVRPNASETASTGSPAISSFTGDSPGVDLGTLQALVTECGGHLWMRAEPPGDMELKIHLPRRVLDRLEAPAAAMPSGRSRWIRRAFGSRH